MQWFRHDLSTRDSDQIFELIEAHGVQGYGIWWVILEECYSVESNGFQVEASETWFKRLSKNLNLTDWRTIIRVLDTMANLGLIDSQMWAEHIVVVPGISKRADDY
ncbi:MAG: Lin1244/Lin1753 domain-containing protein, partial [Cyanobacteria bacterium P01_E01_bin.6]